ncbi:membrane protein [Azorhizobium oxalatiphilum]|uniref:Membrane protein n=1 Tax=Azorhizobium oxalatiphilum TaxID=980631 RepID=A0A917C5G5_9HYPH|nr:TIGR02186 family protein [Azorhizobium oxalatiphilum]GGF73036.1 membrane protein [Azorhizobium oxalatiphilum]
MSALLRRHMGALAVLLMLAGLSAPAAAERLVLSVSQDHVRITSNFTGAELVLFGVVEDAVTGPYDVALTVRGPGETAVTWRKSRVLGLWINTQSRTFLDVPSYLAIATSRPATAIAAPDVLRREQIGLERNMFVQRVGPDFADVVADDPYRAAFLRLKGAEGLYDEQPDGVRFLSATAFRATFQVPGRARTGTYEVSAQLFRDGQVVGRASTRFLIQKAGFEAQTAGFAEHHGLLYGLAVALGALAVGFIANLLFRRD